MSEAEQERSERGFGRFRQPIFFLLCFVTDDHRIPADAKNEMAGRWSPEAGRPSIQGGGRGSESSIPGGSTLADTPIHRAPRKDLALTVNCTLRVPRAVFGAAEPPWSPSKQETDYSRNGYGRFDPVLGTAHNAHALPLAAPYDSFAEKPRDFESRHCRGSASRASRVASLAVEHRRVMRAAAVAVAA